MLEYIKEYWHITSAVILGAAGYGSLRQRVSKLEEARPCMSVEECSKQTEACQRLQQAEFAHGKKEFVEIKAMIAEKDRRQNDRLDAIMQHLLEVKRNG